MEQVIFIGTRLDNGEKIIGTSFCSSSSINEYTCERVYKTWIDGVEIFSDSFKTKKIQQ